MNFLTRWIPQKIQDAASSTREYLSFDTTPDYLRDVVLEEEEEEVVVADNEPQPSFADRAFSLIPSLMPVPDDSEDEAPPPSDPGIVYRTGRAVYNGTSAFVNGGKTVINTALDPSAAATRALDHTLYRRKPPILVDLQTQLKTLHLTPNDKPAKAAFLALFSGRAENIESKKLAITEALKLSSTPSTEEFLSSFFIKANSIRVVLESVAANADIPDDQHDNLKGHITELNAQLTINLNANQGALPAAVEQISTVAAIQLAAANALVTQQRDEINRQITEQRNATDAQVTAQLAAVNAVLERVENLPATLATNAMEAVRAALGAPPAPVTPSSGESASEAPASGSLRALLAQGMSMCAQYIGCAISKGTLQLGISAFSALLNRIVDSTPKTEDNEAILNKINALIINIAAAESLDQVQGLINALMEDLGDSHINLNGFTIQGAIHLEITVDDTLKPFLDGIDHNVPSKPVERPTEEEIEAKIEIQINDLISNANNFTYLYFCGSLCGITYSSSEDYFKIIRQARQGAMKPNSITYEHPNGTVDTTKMDKLIKEKLFTAIDESTTWFFTRWFAKLSYFILQPISSLVLNGLSGKDLTQVLKEELSRQNSAHFDMAQEHILTSLANYLDILDGSYETINNDRAGRTCGIEGMIPKNLERPTLNGGYASSHDLYNTVVTKALAEHPPSMGWIDSAWKLVKSAEIPSESSWSFLNLPIQTFMNIFAGITTLLVFVPEKILNYVLYKGLHNVLIKNQVLDTLISGSLSTLRDPAGNTHSLNLIVLNLLNQIKEGMKASADAPPTSADVSGVDKDKIRVFIKTLFNVLPKSKCEIFNDLKNIYSPAPPSLLDALSAAKKETDKLLEDSLIDPTIDILTDTLSKLMTPSVCKQLSLDILTSVNSNFEEVALPTPAEKQQTIDDIEETLKSILKQSIDQAVDQNLDINKELQKAEIAARYKALKEKTTTLQTTEVEIIDPMLTPITLSVDASTEEWTTAVRNLQDNTNLEKIKLIHVDFQREETAEIRRKIEHNLYLNEQTKTEPKDRHRRLGTLIGSDSAFQVNCDRANTTQIDLSTAIATYQVFTSNLYQPIEDLEKTIQSADPLTASTVIGNCKNTSETIHTQLDPCSISFSTEILQAGLETMYLHHEKTEKLADIKNLFSTFIDKKRAANEPSLFTSVSNLIGMNNSDYYFQQLNIKIHDLFSYNKEEEEEEALRTVLNTINEASDNNVMPANEAIFTQLLKDHQAAYAREFDSAKNNVLDEITGLKAAARGPLEAKRQKILDEKTKRDNFLETAKAALPAIAEEVNAMQPKAIINMKIEIFPKAVFDALPMLKMLKTDQLVELLKKQLTSYTENQILLIIGLLRKPYNYKYGLHQLALIPYVGEKEIPST